MAARRVVVVGSGIAGLAAVRTLAKHGCDVTLVEADDRLGGHARTVETPAGERVDVGFMVMNEVTYPNLVRLFGEIGAELEPSDMSFAVVDGGFGWSFQSTWAWLARNALRPRLWRFARAHAEFARRGAAFLRDPTPRATTLREFAAGLDAGFVARWLVPFVAAVWTTSAEAALEFPAQPLLRFMHHHMFLTLETIAWKTPKGRAEAYVRRLVEACPTVRVMLGARAVRVDGAGRRLLLADGGAVAYDALILACSAPAAAALGPPEAAWLRAHFRTRGATVAAHAAPAGMPPSRPDWSSWNVVAGTAAPRVTYWASRIQNLRDRSVFVSVNPPRDVVDGAFFAAEMEHPVMDAAAYAGQLEEAEHQGTGGVYYAGAWLRNGFHEDGCVSGIVAARRALGRDDVVVEYPTMRGLPAAPVRGTATHRRFGPHEYTASYAMHLFRFDVRCPPPAFARADFFGARDEPLDTCVRRTVLERLGFWPLGAVEVVCNLRYAGLCVNPMTPYFVRDERGGLCALLVEVHNTPWGERCVYAMRVTPDGALEPSVHAKAMHVSPFNPPPAARRTEYAFELAGEARVAITLRDAETGEVRYAAAWAVTDRPHAVATGSWRTLAQIYAHAAALCVRGLRVHPYGVAPAAWTAPLVLAPLAAFALAAAAHVAAASALCAALVGALGACLVAHHRARGTNVLLGAGAAALLVASAALAGRAGPCAAFAAAAFAASLRGGVGAGAMRAASYAHAAVALAPAAAPEAALAVATTALALLWVSAPSPAAYLALATGGRVVVAPAGGPRAGAGVAEIVVHKPVALAAAVLCGGELGLGEAYVRGEWECGPRTTLVDVLEALARSPLNHPAVDALLALSPAFALRRLAFARLFGRLDRAQSARSIAAHYDDGDELFRAFLGDEMVYTCAMWPAPTLRDAQAAKVARVLELAGVRAGEKLLDVGCGWGFLVHAARAAGVDARGVCNCRSMVAAARARYGDAFELGDYRDVGATHDHAAVTAVEMIEAVPAAHYGEFVGACDRVLRRGGRVVMQVIHAYAFNNPVARSRAPRPLGTFVTTHIFPGQQLPNLEFLHEAFWRSGKFRRVCSETASYDYARTLAHWAENLERHRAEIDAHTFRKYQYYLAFCEAGFRTELLHLTRVVFEKL
jgi:predicted NAD/FAD-binding protein/cyclopropane fatty-acyl-phospholipid synthase-like methyltransferase/DUF1365 family protein